MLVPSSSWTPEIQVMAKSILNKALGEGKNDGTDKYQMGLTKIFFRAGMLAFMENLRSARLNDAAIMIQKNLRAKYYRRVYLEMRQAFVNIQSLARGYMTRERAEEARQVKAATTIQRVWRGSKDRKKFQMIRKSVVLFQASAKGFLCRKNILDTRLGNAARIIHPGQPQGVGRRDPGLQPRRVRDQGGN